MKNKLDAMFDIETLGISERALVVEMGLILFDKTDGKIKEEYLFKINLTSYTIYGDKFTMDVSTVLFWLNQNKAAQEKVFKDNEKGIQVSEAFESANKIMGRANNLWCHPSFDYKIYDYTVKTLGLMNNMPFFKVRDLRTAIDLAEYDYKNHPFKGTKHTSLDDCKYQLSYLMECFKNVKGRIK